MLNFSSVRPSLGAGQLIRRGEPILQGTLDVSLLIGSPNSSKRMLIGDKKASMSTSRCSSGTVKRETLTATNRSSRRADEQGRPTKKSPAAGARISTS